MAQHGQSKEPFEEKAPPAGASARDTGLRRALETAERASAPEAEPPRRDRISIADVRELRYWTKTLGVSSDALVGAVREVGHDARKVIEFLQRPRAAS